MWLYKVDWFANVICFMCNSLLVIRTRGHATLVPASGAIHSLIRAFYNFYCYVPSALCVVSFLIFQVTVHEHN